MEETILQNIGLTEAESKVYLALLKLGKSTIGNIVKESRVSNSKIYDILDRLNKKGLVGNVIINNRKKFEAKDPSRLKELIVKKKKEINEVEQILPQLEEMSKYAEPLQEAEILQGANGIKTFNESLLKQLEKGDTFYILGAPKESGELLGAYFKEWHERRVKKGVYCKAIYTKDAEHIAKKRSKAPLTETRIFSKDIKTMANIILCNGYVATALFGNRPLVIIIKNKQIYESYMQFFSLLWKTSKPSRNK